MLLKLGGSKWDAQQIWRIFIHFFFGILLTEDATKSIGLFWQKKM